MIARLAWRNLWRNKRRTLITTASIAFAVLLAVVMKSFQTGVFDNLVHSLAGFYSGYIQVHDKGYWDERILDNTFRYDTAFLNTIQRQPFVTTVAPRIEQFALLSSEEETFGVMLTGIDPQQEAALTRIPSKIIEGSYFHHDEHAVLIAEGIAKRLNVSVGDTLTALGQGYQGSTAADKFVICGILSYAIPQLNDRLVFLPLRTAQELLSGDQLLTSLVIGIERPADLEAVREAITAAVDTNYEVMTWKELMPDIANHIEADSVSFYFWTGILYVVIAFGVVGTLIMMFAERRYELGMLVAIGMKKGKVGLMLVIEGLFISLLGTLTGMLLSVPIVYYLSLYPIRFGGKLAETYARFGFEPVFPTALSGEIFLTQALIVLLIALCVGCYPIVKVRGLDPVLAMKR